MENRLLMVGSKVINLGKMHSWSVECSTVHDWEILVKMPDKTSVILVDGLASRKEAELVAKLIFNSIKTNNDTIIDSEAYALLVTQAKQMLANTKEDSVKC